MHHAECDLCLRMVASTNFKACHCRAGPWPPVPLLPTSPSSWWPYSKEPDILCWAKPGYTTLLLKVSIPASPPPPQCHDALPAQIQSPRHRERSLWQASTPSSQLQDCLRCGTTFLSLPFPSFQPTIPGLLLGAGAGEQSLESISPPPPLASQYPGPSEVTSLPGLGVGPALPDS